MKKVCLTIFLLVIALSFVGCNNSTPDNTNMYEYYEAINHIGENITVYGNVDSTHYAFDSNGSPTFINMGKPYGDLTRCTVVIWGEDRSKFNSPETVYDGKKIKVTGIVRKYKGAAQITVNSPSQIEILE